MIIKKLLCVFVFLLCTNAIAEKKTLNILVVVNRFPVLSEVFALNQITGLIDRGHKVEIFSMKYPTQSVMHEVVTQYNLLNKTFYGKMTKAQLEKYDVILCQFGQLGKQLLALKKKYGFSAKLVTCFRGRDISARIQGKLSYYNDLFEGGDLFLPVCDFFKKKLLSLGAPLQKVKIQYSAIDCSLFTFKKRKLPSRNSKRPLRIMTAARLVEKKGHKYVLRALALFAEKCPKMSYLIIGSGPLRNKLKLLVKELNLEHCVQFIEAVPHGELVQLLDAADLFVLPSIVDRTGDLEGIPNALKEAMVMGIPVISTTHSGIPELIEHGKSGLLVPEMDARALYEALVYAYEHPKHMEKMASCGYEKVVKNFELESQSNQLERYLRELCI